MTICRFERQYESQSWMELLRPQNIVRVHCAIFTHIWSQYTGTNAMMYYIVYIFQMAGLSGNANLLASSIQYIINVAMTVPALMFVDRWPRRRLMMAGSFLLAVFLFTQAGLMASYGHAVPGGLDGAPTVTWVVTHSRASKAIIACSYLFIATYAPTWGYVWLLCHSDRNVLTCYRPAGWIYPTEIIPLYIRSKAVSLSTAFNWICNFALTFYTPPGFKNIQWKVHCIFGTFCLTAFIHVFLLFQESRGKSLEEMDDVFNNQSIWAFRVHEAGSRFSADVEAAKRDLETGKADNVEPKH